MESKSDDRTVDPSQPFITTARIEDTPEGKIELGTLKNEAGIEVLLCRGYKKSENDQLYGIGVGVEDGETVDELVVTLGDYLWRAVVKSLRKPVTTEDGTKPI